MGKGIRRHLTERMMLRAIKDSHGILSIIARRCRASPTTVKKSLELYPIVKQAYLDECDRILDIAEDKVLASIMNNDITTAKWYLTNKGKERGYGRQDMSINNTIELPVFIDDMTEERK